MTKLFQLLLILLAGAFVALADILTKKFSVNQNFWTAIKNPWFLLVILLYIFQIAIFVYVFTKKWNLGAVGAVQNIFYVLIVVLVGVVMFREKVSAVQATGVVLALISLFLINA